MGMSLDARKLADNSLARLEGRLPGLEQISGFDDVPSALRMNLKEAIEDIRQLALAYRLFAATMTSREPVKISDESAIRDLIVSAGGIADSKMVRLVGYLAMNAGQAFTRDQLRAALKMGPSTLQTACKNAQILGLLERIRERGGIQASAHLRNWVVERGRPAQQSNGTDASR